MEICARILIGILESYYCVLSEQDKQNLSNVIEILQRGNEDEEERSKKCSV